MLQTRWWRQGWRWREQPATVGLLTAAGCGGGEEKGGLGVVKDYASSGHPRMYHFKSEQSWYYAFSCDRLYCPVEWTCVISWYSQHIDYNQHPTAATGAYTRFPPCAPPSVWTCKMGGLGGILVITSRRVAISSSKPLPDNKAGISRSIRPSSWDNHAVCYNHESTLISLMWRIFTFLLVVENRRPMTPWCWRLRGRPGCENLWLCQ